jgi:hypothetical protein
MATAGLTKVGIGLESSGWALPADTGVAPSYLLPVTSVSASTVYEQVLDSHMRGVDAKDFAAFQGQGRVEMTLEGPFYPEVCGYLLALIMGVSGTPSGASAPYTHTMTTFTSPPTSTTKRSLSVQVDDAVDNSRFIGMVLSSLTLRFSASEGMLSYVATLVGQQQLTGQTAMGTTGDLAPLTPINAFLGWHADITQGGTNARGIEGEITFEREVMVRHSPDQSDKPSDIQVGGLTVTSRLTLDYYQIDDVNLYLNKTQSAFVASFSFTPPDVSYAKTLTITCSKMDYGDGPVEIDRSGANMVLAWAMRALANTTDGSSSDPAPCKITLANARSSAYL